MVARQNCDISDMIRGLILSRKIASLFTKHIYTKKKNTQVLYKGTVNYYCNTICYTIVIQAATIVIQELHPNANSAFSFQM